MNEELQKALADTINNALTAADTTTDFLLSEIPDVIQQLLIWKMVESLIIFCVCIVAIVTIPILMFKLFKHLKKVNAGRYNEGVEYMTAFGLLFLTFPALALNLDWLQIWLAPKIYLLEYAANLVLK